MTTVKDRFGGGGLWRWGIVVCYVNWHNPLYLLYACTFSSYSAQLHCKELRTDIYKMNESMSFVSMTNSTSNNTTTAINE